NSVTTWICIVNNFWLGFVGFVVSETSGRWLVFWFIGGLPKNKLINTTSVMHAAVGIFLWFIVSPSLCVFSTE
ncbi:PTS lactose transporter subunit IIBC, partial [Enterococcus faecium]